MDDRQLRDQRVDDELADVLDAALGLAGASPWRSCASPYVYVKLTTQRTGEAIVICVGSGLVLASCVDSHGY